MTGPADIRDQQWLDERIEDLRSGVAAAREIYVNWFDGRNVARLHPGLKAGEYIAATGITLTLAEAFEAMPDAASRQIAAVAGVGKTTVERARKNGPNGPVSIRDSRTGNLRPAFTPEPIVMLDDHELPPDPDDAAYYAAARKAMLEAARALEAAADTMTLLDKWGMEATDAERARLMKATKRLCRVIDYVNKQRLRV